MRRRGSTREVSSATPVRDVHRSPSLNIERSTFVVQIKVEVVALSSSLFRLDRSLAVFGQFFWPGLVAFGGGEMLGVEESSALATISLFWEFLVHSMSLMPLYCICIKEPTHRCCQNVTL